MPLPEKLTLDFGQISRCLSGTCLLLENPLKMIFYMAEKVRFGK